MQSNTHLGTYGILTEDDQILLVKKSRGPYMGKLDLPGGSLEHGEDIEEALAREIKEETGLTVSKMSLIDNYTALVDFSDERGEISMYHVGLIYRVADFNSDSLIKDMNEEDSFGADWYKISDLTNDQLSPFANKVVSSLL